MRVGLQSESKIFMMATLWIVRTKSRITKQKGGRKGHPNRMRIEVGLTPVIVTGFDGSKRRHRNYLLNIVLAMQHMD